MALIAARGQPSSRDVVAAAEVAQASIVKDLSVNSALAAL
jgi:hypothetical protein